MCRVLSPIYFELCVVISEYFISERNIPILLKCDELKKPIYLEFVLNDIFQKDLFSVMDQIGIQILYTPFMLLLCNRTELSTKTNPRNLNVTLLTRS